MTIIKKRVYYQKQTLFEVCVCVYVGVYVCAF